MEKYKISDQVVPQEMRESINNKILYLIDNDAAESNGISREDIFNAYTGDGGLHGLKYADFDNYSEFASAKKEIENGQFFTPAPLCRFVMESLKLDDSDVVGDLTCGMGSFFNFAPMEANVYGCELDAKAYKVARYLYPKANLTCGDIRTYSPGIKMDYVVGNPPFNLRWWVDGAQVLSQLYYCQKAAELLKPLGIMALVVPASFLADDFSDGAMIREMEKSFSFLGQFSLDADTFAALGVKGYPTKLQFWQRRPAEDTHITGWTAKPYTTETISFASPDWNSPKWVYSLCIREAQEQLHRNRSHILLEIARDKASSSEFLYKVKKYLYDIKHHPNLKEKYVKCCEYLNRFYTQKQPDGMSHEEWARVRITEAKVLAYLHATVRKQHPVEYRDEIKMVKHAYSIGYKAYSPAARRLMTDSQKSDTSISSIVRDNIHEDILDDYGLFNRMIRRRSRAYEIENRPLADMEQDAEIAAWLDRWAVYDSENEDVIRLNDIQKHDLNLVLKKRNMLLQWEQGSGKTLAGIASSMYRMERLGAYCTFVVSNAISIRNNWDVVLPSYTDVSAYEGDAKTDWSAVLDHMPSGLSYVMVRRLADLEKIKRGDFVLITLNMVSKYRKQLKNWIKAHQQKVVLCLDESDEITNPAGVHTKAVLDIFRRCRWKLEMTGTSTRNNIAEFIPQLELAYNNSVNMISWADTLYYYDKKDKDKDGNPIFKETNNPYYGQPIPAYRPGYRLFSESHLPEKITVFGVGQMRQDIYNADVLSGILDKFVITRSFEEVAGKDIKRIHQVPVRFTDAERAVYSQIIKEFYMLRGNYFASTGNSRKDSMMRLIQQITLMLRFSAAPDTLKEYVGGQPTKIRKVMDMLEKLDDTIVAIGVRHKNVLDSYAAAIRERFPDRPLFIVTGSTTTFAQRRKLRKTLKESGNGILLCTQQSLPSSVNFEYVDHVIIPELHYNNSRMSQFYFRFIRYTSTREKHIYFVTYLGSIESNQMQMVLAKEKINLFMRGRDTNLDEIYDTFGVDYDLMSMLMSRELDENGNFQIRWGEQEIA